MASMSKDVYKTIKRSITATTNGIAATANGVVSNVINWDSNISRLPNQPASAARKYWIHPPKVLRECRVDYIARLWGKTEVSEPKGSHVVRDAILKIRFQYEQNKSIAGYSGSKLPKVIIQINAEKIAIVDQKTNKNLYVFPLRQISFSADDKEDKQIFSIIVRTDDAKNVCFAFMSEKMAEEITLTIGQAFDLAYEKYCRNKGENSRRDLENQKKMILLQKRIRELETENATLRAENKGLKIEMDNAKAITGAPTPNVTPLLPNTPVPPAPFLSQIAIARPPLQQSRRAQQFPNNTASDTSLFSLNDVFARERQGPDVGTRLQGLQMDRMEDLFDDEFDPRAGEHKTSTTIASGSSNNVVVQNVSNGSNGEATKLGNNGRVKNGVGAFSSSANSPTVEDFEALLKQIDERLAAVQEGETAFASESLERGDTGDVGRDLADYSAVGQPGCSTPGTPDENNGAARMMGPLKTPNGSE